MFLATDLNGRECGRFLSGSSNYKSVGAETAGKSFQDGLLGLQYKYGIKMEDIAFSVWGISGYDSEEDYCIIQEQVLKTGIAKEKTFLCNDGLLAYYAQAKGPGLVIIAGTGSIVLGIGPDRKTYRSGGWGYNISDIGSGYWIGVEALKRTLLYCDGCTPYQKLYDEIRKYFGKKDFQNLPYTITGLTNYFEIAKVARIVVELCGNGEEESQQILKEGAISLAKMAVNIYKKLGLSPGYESHMVFSGGVLKNEVYQNLLQETIMEQFKEEKPKIIFNMQKNEPVYGGLSLARQLYERNESSNE